MSRSAFEIVRWAHRGVLVLSVGLTAMAAFCGPAAATVAPASASAVGMIGFPQPASRGCTAITAPETCSNSAEVVFDETPPTIVVSTPAAGADFAVGALVSSDVACSDPGGSGVLSCVYPAMVDTAAAGAHEFMVTATDVAGNTATETVGYTVGADRTPPTIAFSTPTNGQHLVQGASVTSVVSCSDAGGSGLSSCVYPAMVDTAATGTHTFAATAQDGAGNTTSSSVQYIVDASGTTDPVTITVTTPAEGGQYAQGSSLASDAGCSAPGSGIASCDYPATVDTSSVGAHTFVVSAADNEGHHATKTVHYTVVLVDQTPPTIVVSTPAVGANFALGASVSSVVACSDPGGSGVASCLYPAMVDTAAAGAHQFKVTATDVAGNTATKTVGYTVDPAPAGGGGTGGGGGGATGGTGDGGTAAGGTGTGATGVGGTASGGTGTGGTGTGGTGTGGTSGTGGTGDASSTKHAVVSLGRVPAFVTPSSAGTIRVLLRCGKVAKCTGTAKITVARTAASARSAATSTIILASGRYSVAAGSSRRLVIKLNPIGRKRLRLSRSALKATLTLTPSDRKVKPTKRTIRLKRIKR